MKLIASCPSLKGWIFIKAIVVGAEKAAGIRRITGQAIADV